MEVGWKGRDGENMGWGGLGKGGEFDGDFGQKVVGVIEFGPNLTIFGNDVKKFRNTGPMQPYDWTKHVGPSCAQVFVVVRRVGIMMGQWNGG